jgi:muramidase (phage lysozyme)
VIGVDGKRENFTDYAEHPFAHREPKLIRHVPLLRSTASGRYQVLYRFWRVYELQLGLADFSPASQDAVALRQAKECGGLAHLANGELALALKACSKIWASLPGSPYGQPTRTMEVAVSKYHEYLNPEVGATVSNE